MQTLLLLSFWVLSSGFLFLESVYCSVHQYSNGEFTAVQNGFIFYGGSEAMRLSKSSSTKNGVADGRSYIRFDQINLKHVAKPGTGGLIQAIIFEVAEKDNVGGKDALCCTSDLAMNEGCEEGKVILKPSLGDLRWPFAIDIQLESGSVTHTQRVNITRTGFYNLFFVFCDPELKGLIIDGSTIWKNPTGYLPGSMAPMLPFYGKLSLAYMLLGLAWFLQCLRFWKDVMRLHNHLTVIIALGMCEATLWYFDYANFNSTGFRPVVITTWAVTIEALKKALSRVLILAVSMGYGVARPNLGAETVKVAILGGIYFLAAEVMGIFENAGAINDLSGKAKVLLVLPVGILDGIFILWVFMSLSRTLEKLEARKWAAKLDFYRKLTITLSVFVLIAVALIGYEFYFKTTDASGEQWERAWTISAFWNILTLILLSVLCILWAPSENSVKFEYSEDTTSHFDDEDAILLTCVTSVNPELNNSNVEKKDKRENTKLNLDDSEDGKRE